MQFIDAAITAFADVVEDHLDAALARLGHDDRGHVLGRVVDRHVGAELQAQLLLGVGANGGDHAGAEVLGQLDGRRSRSAGGGVDEDGLAGLQVGPVDQAQPGQVVREEQARGVGQGDGLGHLEDRRRRADDVLGVTATGHLGRGRHPLAQQRLGAGAAGVDDAERLHAGAVGQLETDGHVAAVDPLEVVQVEGDGLHPHADLVGARLGDRNLVEHEGGLRLAVHVGAPGSHGGGCHRCRPVCGVDSLVR